MKIPFRHLAVGAVTVAVFACGSDKGQDVQPETVRPIKLVTVVTTGSAQSRSYPAVVEAATSSDLAFQVGGLIQELPVVEAQVVERGSVLAKLDQRDLRNQLATAQAEFDTAEADYQRALRLQEGNAISTSDVEQRTARRDTAKASLDSAQKALGDTVLTAPFAGVVTQVNVERFQTVNAQQTILTLMGTDGSFEAAINVPASVVATSTSDKERQAFIIFDAAPSVRIPARFKEAQLQADAESQTFEVRHTFEAPDDLVILPGMNATIVIESSSPSAVGDLPGAGVAVPLDAVLSEGDRTYVWVIDPAQMTASKRWVRLQAGVGETAVVIDGLTPGETIAGAGASYLAEGMKVREWTD